MTNLTCNHTKSCGCLSEENMKQHVIDCTTHGECQARLYRIWNDMRMRTTDPNRDSYCRYGARGISVCDEWYRSYETFRDWAVQNGYNESLTLDRIDSNGDYEPPNCRWATVKEQANNRRTNRLIELDGVIHTLSEWSDITGIHWATIRGRIDRGWPVSDALTLKPSQVRFENRVTANE